MSQDDNNVLFLKFKSPHVEEGMMAFLSCVHCKNKTFTLTSDQPPPAFPLLRCAACGSHLGRMGWVRPEDPLVSGST